jgi:hypothetical protein
MDFRTVNHESLYVLMLVVAGMTIWCWFARRGFLHSHASIATHLDLEDLKRFAKVDMYFALATIALFMAILATFGIAIWIGDVSGYEFVGLVLLFGILAVAGAILTVGTNKIRSLPVEDKSLQAEVTHVLTTWKSKPFPDW